MRTLALLLASSLAFAGEQAGDKQGTFSIAPHDADRRFVVVDTGLKAKEPFYVVDEIGQYGFGQITNGTLRVLVPHIAANQKPKFTVTSGTPNRQTMAIAEDPNFLSIKMLDREVTRYHMGSLAEKHKKPFLYPLFVNGVNVLRGYPMEDKAGEAKDHPHHTGIYHAFGEVNGKEYWSKTPITPKKILAKEAGPAYARIVAENAWGEDLVERQEILVLNSGNDAVIDFTFTLTAANGPVVFGKDLKMAKEGSFAVRVAAGLSAKGDAPEMITDSKGGKGEKAARASAAPWVHYSGDVDGKKIGVSIMNHPSSFRYPGDWHVRAYGLFAANPWIVKGPNTLEKGQSITLGYRVYVHGGAFDAGKIPDVFAGYTNAKAVAE